MNSQPKIIQRLDTELQFPNIVLQNETDWDEKLGVTSIDSMFWENLTWQNLIYTIFLKYRYANIIVMGSALQLLQHSTAPLLPKINSILNDTELYKSGMLNIKMMGYDSNLLISNAKIEFLWSPTGASVPYIFTLIETHNGDIDNCFWNINTYLYVYNRGTDTDYVNHRITYRVKPEDEFEFEIVINNLPLLNPIVQNKKFTVTTRNIIKFSEYQHNVFNTIVNFTYFYYGIDSATGNSYKIKYNGYANFVFNDQFDSYLLGISAENKLWIEIWQKSPTDTEYTFKSREELIGTENCYVKSIKLVSDIF